MTETRLYPLKEYNPELYDRLTSCPDTALNGFQLIHAESGDVNLVYNNIPLHSTVNPQAEAMEEFNRIKPDVSTIVILMGLGLGYALKRFFISSKSKIIVYEPDINILKFTLMAVDYSEEIASERVFLANTPAELETALDKTYSYKDKIVFSCLPSSKQLYNTRLEKTVNDLSKIVPNLESNYRTLFEYSWRWLVYGISKLSPMFLEDIIKLNSSITILEDKFRGKTALIVSAGPSLDKTIEVIKANRDKFIIFCANVAYKKLVAAGITPDFAVCLDAPDFSSTIADYEHSQTNLIIHSAANPQAFKSIKPNLFFTFYCKNDLFSRWLADFCGFSIDNYKTKGSVSHLALVAAKNMGCNPIILTGQDLAFTDGKIYSSGCFWGDMYCFNEKNELDLLPEANKDLAACQKTEIMKKTHYFNVPGQDGNAVLTSPTYAGFIKHFEDFAAANRSIRLINCSPGGAMIEGFENSELAELAALLEPIGINVNKYLKQLVDSEKDPVKSNYDNILAEITEFCRTENYLPIIEKGKQASANLLKSLKTRHLDPNKARKLYKEVLSCYDELENRLFSRWSFGIGVAFKEITELNAVIKDESGGNDLLFRFAKAANNLFTTTRKNLETYLLQN